MRRNNLLDWPTKISLVVTKTEPTSLAYAVEFLFAQMWRKGGPGPYGSKELGEVLQDILWVKTYSASFLWQYPDLLKIGYSDIVCNSGPSSQDAGPQRNKLARHLLDSPMKFFLKTDGA